MIRTRFAPSPTGYLHLGGARTALFAWAWARKHGGEFLLRVEDTDAARSSEAHSGAIIRAMQWLGLNFDGEAQFQSQNIARHKTLAAQLKESDAVYEDGGALRLRTPPDGEVFFEDRVCGRLAVDNKELEDPVILRGDGTPTYIFASAADDMEDGITDVIRGDDHVRNTHKQLHIYAACRKTPPRFAHLPMILSANGERLSKRNAAVDVMQYEKDGFLPAAVNNYLARLSWSRGDAE
ncbi:MAG: glutamate--tRNA ligase, partial [Gammaproteobacteria bacterium]